MDVTNSALREIIWRIVAAINFTKKFDPLPEEPNIGYEEIQAATSFPQITWVPKKDTAYKGPHDQPDDAQAYYETWTLVEVHVWGKDLDEAIKLRDAVLIAGHVLYSPNAFEPTGSGTYSKGLSSGESGVEITFTTGFLIPIIYEEFATAIIQFANASVPTQTGGLYVDDALGQNPEALPP